LTRLTIRVKQPETEHTVRVRKLRTWLDGGGKSPNEQVMKSRLREMLGLDSPPPAHTRPVRKQPSDSK
jgi:hypothetical protein